MSLFRSASFRLTAFYVLIVMIISVGFTIAVYELSSNELAAGLNRPSIYISQLPSDNPMWSMMRDVENMRSEQLEISSGHLLANLIRLNLLILILSTVGSYFFARWSLRPIEEAMESQARFTADASHELKTPLTAMKSEIEVTLRDKKLGSTQARELLQSNLEEIGKLEALSNALLELAKSEDKTKRDFREFSLSDIVASAYERVEKIARVREIEFENNLRDVKVKADQKSLTELFVILLDNAIKYSSIGSKIKIAIKREMRHAEVSIQDEGIGIKKEDLSHIFDRFYRADTSRNKDKVSGYGLGLAIAKRIVELHDGSISAESKTGKGSIFTVKLPIS